MTSKAGILRHAVAFLGIVTTLLIIFNHVLVLWHLPDENADSARSRLGGKVRHGSFPLPAQSQQQRQKWQEKWPKKDEEGSSSQTQCPLAPECPFWSTACKPRSESFRIIEESWVEQDEQQGGSKGETEEGRNMVLGMVSPCYPPNHLLYHWLEAAQSPQPSTYFDGT